MLDPSVCLFALETRRVFGALGPRRKLREAKEGSEYARRVRSRVIALVPFC